MNISPYRPIAPPQFGAMETGHWQSFQVNEVEQLKKAVDQVDSALTIKASEKSDVLPVLEALSAFTTAAKTLEQTGVNTGDVISDLWENILDKAIRTLLEGGNIKLEQFTMLGKMDLLTVTGFADKLYTMVQQMESIVEKGSSVNSLIPSCNRGYAGYRDRLMGRLWQGALVEARDRALTEGFRGGTFDEFWREVLKTLVAQMSQDDRNYPSLITDHLKAEFEENAQATQSTLMKNLVVMSKRSSGK